MPLTPIVYFGLLLMVADPPATYSRLFFQLDVGNPTNLCPQPNETCANGKLHYLCPNQDREIDTCASYEEYPLNIEIVNTFTDGHNGIRSKVARDFYIANMNLMYWSSDLECMAQIYLRTCFPGPDSCNVIGTNRRFLTQNYLFQDKLLKRWSGRIVRSWYVEIGYGVRSLNEFFRKRRTTALGNFSHMVMPVAEFVGCAAARMHGTYMITCYYDSPPYDERNYTSFFKVGEPCTQCRNDSTACSRLFRNLCGVDVKLLKGPALTPNSHLVAAGLFMLMVSLKVL